MAADARRPPRLDKKPRPDAEQASEGIRLNRFIAQSGMCSRRKADDLIAAGAVQVNGEVVVEMGRRLSEGDSVSVNGRTLTPLNLGYILLNKPTDAITTTSDDRGRRTVMDLLSISDGEKSGLYPVGRLDRDTTGALLITNDGELANRLMHPRYEIAKLYVANVDRELSSGDVERLRAGVQLDDGPAKAEYADFVEGDRSRVVLQIHEGRNRQVRRMFEALGATVNALERVQYAGLDCKGLRPGKWRNLTHREVSRLRRAVGLRN
ncbi:MAG: rRNA pseudouridine synthase [Bacteroidetes bacterium]|nr:rRNA pseudouridine synthase [Bacteroidota bacterium]